LTEKTINLQYIGKARTPYKDIHQIPTQPQRALGVPGKLIIIPEFQEGLDGLETFPFISVIFHLHKIKKFHLEVIPFMRSSPRGVFSTCSPHRPNPIGLSIVRLVSIEGNVVFIENVDMLDGTPILDIKPYLPFYGDS